VLRRARHDDAKAGNTTPRSSADASL
jgi:hypothetical protein